MNEYIGMSPSMGMSYCCPMMGMPQQDKTEVVYPRMYVILIPYVKRHCDHYDSMYGMMYMPTREQMDAMINEIEKNSEADILDELSKSEKGSVSQFGFGGRRIFRDFIELLILRQLLGRRRYYSYPRGYLY